MNVLWGRYTIVSMSMPRSFPRRVMVPTTVKACPSTRTFCPRMVPGSYPGKSRCPTSNPSTIDGAREVDVGLAQEPARSHRPTAGVEEARVGAGEPHRLQLVVAHGRPCRAR